MCFRGKPGRWQGPEEGFARSRVSCGCNRREHLLATLEGSPALGWGEPRVMLGFPKKPPHGNAGALRGDWCHWAGVTAASVAQPASRVVPERCNDDG